MDKPPHGKQCYIPYERVSAICQFLGRMRKAAPDGFNPAKREDIEREIEEAAALLIFAAHLARGRRDRAEHGQPIANKELRDKLNQLHRSAAALSQALATPDPRLPLATRRHRAALFRRMRATTARHPKDGIGRLSDITANGGEWEQTIHALARAIASGIQNETIAHRLNRAAARLHAPMLTPGPGFSLNPIECVQLIERLARNARDRVRLTQSRARHQGKTAYRDFVGDMLGVWLDAVHRWPKPEEFKEFLRLVTEPLAQHLPGIAEVALTPASCERMLATWRRKIDKSTPVQAVGAEPPDSRV